MADGYSSQYCQVCTQGTVLGSLLFLSFINDIAEDRSPQLFVSLHLLWNLVFVRLYLLQKDLDKQVHWNKIWEMTLNIRKCTIMSVTIGTKKTNLITSIVWMACKLAQMILASTLVSQWWNQHINRICGTANRVLGFLFRSCSNVLRI